MPSDSLTVGDVLRRQARDRAEHPLLVCDTERLSYLEADRRSAQLARGLIALGAERAPTSAYSSRTEQRGLSRC